MVHKVSDRVTRADLFLVTSALFKVANLHHMALISLRDGNMSSLANELQGSGQLLNDLFEQVLNFSIEEGGDVRR